MMEASYFRYLNMSKEYDADGVNDVEEYAEMKRAMSVCNISASDQNCIFQIVASILHLGNVTFLEENNEAKIKDADST
jgi:myosin heavy subunit